MGLDRRVAARTPCHYPFLVRPPVQWRNGRKLPRGWVCTDRAAVDRALVEIAATVSSGPTFFVQEWLGEATPNFSVCGFFDARQPARNLLAVAKRRLMTGPHRPARPWWKAVDDPGRLTALTERVLREIDYTGPFELEFLQDAAGQFRLLELNTRFWMQHGLFLPFGNGVVRRYLGLELPPAQMEAIPLGTTGSTACGSPSRFSGPLAQSIPLAPPQKRLTTAARDTRPPHCHRFVIRRKIAREGTASTTPWNQ